MKRLMVIVLAFVLWSSVAVFGGFSGWWLTPMAPTGDARAFMDATIALVQRQRPGNIAIVLMRGGEVFAEHFESSADRVDRVDRETRFALASMSKWFAAYGVMQLVQAGSISLDAPVSTYLKQWKLPAGSFNNDLVTVRGLLSHTAGLTDELGFGDYTAAEILPSTQASLRQPRASSGGAATIAVGQAPGSAWKYSGGGYLILQALIEDVTGKSFAEWMRHFVFDPLGMHRSSYAFIGGLDNASRFYDTAGKQVAWYQYAAPAATGLSASANDLVRFAEAQLRADGVNPRLLSPANIEAMQKPHGRMFGADIWGLGVMLYAPTAGGAFVFGHDGSNAPAINSSMRINPDNGDAIIVLVSGHKSLASLIGYEWTVWQTGRPDFLMVDKAIASAIVPLVLGLAGILVTAVFVHVRQRRMAQASA